MEREIAKVVIIENPDRRVWILEVGETDGRSPAKLYRVLAVDSGKRAKIRRVSFEFGGQCQDARKCAQVKFSELCETLSDPSNNLDRFDI